ncbi:MAG TPA: coproporphyrinogen dehydrogenase HemZ [Feifaniaceae bacterium]|nr:coproporphyrinogen dehydrogenase HemZ [Feifaniaceae bacterium]
MVTLHTNREEYWNDLCEILRAYLGMVEIEAVPAWEDAKGYALSVILSKEGAYQAVAQGQKDGVSFTASIPVKANSNDPPLLIKRQEKRAMKIALFRALRELEPDVPLPWGSLTGIRPTKLLRELTEDFGEQEALRIFSEEFDVMPQKAALAAKTTEVQRPILKSVRPDSVSLYIGVPYCRTRCMYCSFPSVVSGDRGVPDAYFDALLQEISLSAAIIKDAGFHVRSTYVGGGTPTVLSADQLTRLLEHTGNCYGGFGMELTVEAGRPDSLNEEKLRALHAAGAGRISLNPQTMQPETLKRIGREHTPEELIAIYRLAREIGFQSINMDVIAGLPGEGASEFLDTLQQIEALGPDNLTVHTLAIKRSSRLKERIEAYPLPGAAEAERMVEFGMEYAQSMGMRPYYMYRQKYMRGNLENVGYAVPGRECVYNVDMMEEAVSVMAHGAGSMTKRVFAGRDLRVERLPAPKDIVTYLNKLSAFMENKKALFCG